jgi:hypothetical protein
VKSDGSDPHASKVATQASDDTNKLLNPLLAHSTMAAVILLFLLSLHDTQRWLLSGFSFSGGTNGEQMFNGLARTAAGSQMAQTMALLSFFCTIQDLR